MCERDAANAEGREWEEIAKLCDFNPKSTRNSKDTSRMRSIILQLKQTPLAATQRQRESKALLPLLASLTFPESLPFRFVLLPV